MSTANEMSDAPQSEPASLEHAAQLDLERALASLAKVAVPNDLKHSILAQVASESTLLGFGKRQWAWASLSFGAWMLLTQGMFSWMLGGMSAL